MDGLERARLVARRFEQELGYGRAEVFPIHDEKEGGKVLYHMIHASDHPEALSLMVRAYRKVSGHPDWDSQEVQFDLLQSLHEIQSSDPMPEQGSEVLSIAAAIAAYVLGTRNLEALPSATETTFYPDIKNLLSIVLRAERLPFEVITGTSEARARRRDMPDFVLGDSTLFVAVYGEIKRADTTLADLAASTENKDQIGRYLAQTGVVLLCNVRGFGLLTCDPSYKRDPTQTVPPKAADWRRPSISGPR